MFQEIDITSTGMSIPWKIFLFLALQMNQTHVDQIVINVDYIR